MGDLAEGRLARCALQAMRPFQSSHAQDAYPKSGAPLCAIQSRGRLRHDAVISNRSRT